MAKSSTFTFEGKILKSTQCELRKAQMSFRLAFDSHKGLCFDEQIPTGTIGYQLSMGNISPAQAIILRTDREISVCAGAYLASKSGEIYAAGDGIEDTFSRSLENLPIVPGSVVVTLGAVVGTDDGSGNIVGAGIVTGSIVYASGLLSVTLAAPLADHEVAVVDYDHYLTGITAKPNLEEQEGFFGIVGSISAVYITNQSGNTANIEYFVAGEAVTP